MQQLTVKQWNVLWYRGACWQGMDWQEVAWEAGKRPGYAVCQVVAEGYPPMYGAAPSGWIASVTEAGAGGAAWD